MEKTMDLRVRKKNRGKMLFNVINRLRRVKNGLTL